MVQTVAFGDVLPNHDSLIIAFSNQILIEKQITNFHKEAANTPGKSRGSLYESSLDLNFIPFKFYLSTSEWFIS